MVMPRLLQLRRFTDIELAKEILARALEDQDGVLNQPVDENHPAWKSEEVSDVAATVDDDDEDFDVAPDARERQAAYGLAVKRGVRKVDEPHAE